MTTHELPTSIDEIVEVELLRGAHAGPDAVPELLVEVPHGADAREHYEALRARLRGPLPPDLHLFFNLNTDIGAWAYGRATAAAYVAARPEAAALVVRSLIPRTFVDCNRAAGYSGGRLDQGALTPGIPSYVEDPEDRAMLLERHGRYLAVTEQAYARVCGAGGRALVPHSYGPRSLGIERVDADIVDNLRWACAPERHESWPLRAEVDLLTRDGEGRSFAPEGIEDRLLRDFAAAGYQAVANDTYYLHPITLAHTWSTRYPGQVLCLELRRDLLVEAWTPLSPMRVVDETCQRVAELLAPALAKSPGCGAP